MKYIIIGAGMSGLATANMLKERGNEVVVFESSNKPGGMIKCDIIEGCLFHRTGGHVFNTKRPDVMNWFWKHFDKENEFTKSLRNSVVAFDNNQIIPYPIENHVYLLESQTQKTFIEDLLKLHNKHDIPKNFEEFLKGRFGDTLYNIYFKPYNYKVWRRDLSKVPLSWLEGKLPMPTIQEMIYNNMNHVEERQFVHSSFYYPKKGGSQFLADRLSKNLTIRYNTPVMSIQKKNGNLYVNNEECDRIVYCGNIKNLPMIYKMESYVKAIDALEAHGTTSVFCEIDANLYSWIYQPSREHESHRIICTGNFSKANNSSSIKEGRITATIEFTDYIPKEEIINNLAKISFNPKYLTHNYEEYTYPIQDDNTRELITNFKKSLSKEGIYLVGRFAEWEYCNMDIAIGSAMDLMNLL